MRPVILAPVALIALLLPPMPLGMMTTADAQGRAQPRAPEQTEQREPPRSGDDERAKPRQPSAPPERQPAPRRPEPPPRVVVPTPSPRIYVFPPRSPQRGFYYHPRFLFYYGPYYGPLYSYPQGWSARFAMSSVRLKVKPINTEVYLNGYFAGLVDDFDGILQRLYVPVGEHTLEFYLEGYRTFRRPVYFSGGDASDIMHVMERLRPGEMSEAPSAPRPLPDRWTSAAPSRGERPNSPFGILAVRMEPDDAELRIDEERWMGSTGRSELVIHLEAGWHRIEVRRAGYRAFSTEVELAEGERTGLRVVLTPEPR